MTPEPDWQGAFYALQRYIESKTGLAIGFAHGLKDVAPEAAATMLQILAGPYGSQREIAATYSLYHLPGGDLVGPEVTRSR